MANQTKKLKSANKTATGNSKNNLLADIANMEWRITVDSLEYLVLLLDKSGKIIRGNRTVEQWDLGLVTKIKGLSLSQLLHPHCTNKRCYLRHGWESALEYLSKNKSFVFEVKDENLKRYLRYQFRPIAPFTKPAYTQEIPFAILIVIDISKEKIIRDQLYQHSMEMKAIFSALNDQCIRLDEKGIIVSCDGYSGVPGLNHECVGRSAESVMPDTCKAKCIQALQECKNFSSVVMVESTIETNQGTEIFEFIFLPVLYQNTIVIVKNQTEKRRLESVAQQIEMMNNLGMVFSTLRHEIGNPMNTIKMTATVLKQNIGKFSNPKIMEYTDRIISELARVEFLLKNLKSFSMWEDCQLINLKFRDFFHNFIEFIKDDLAKLSIQLRTSIQPTIKFIYTDPRALQQVLMNIINNAKDALNKKKNPVLTIEVKNKAGRISIVVKDNGSGIPEANLNKVFNPFFTTKKHGTGLGLLITQNILSRLDGTISIQNRKPRGTQVLINLPEK